MRNAPRRASASLIGEERALRSDRTPRAPRREPRSRPRRRTEGGEDQPGKLPPSRPLTGRARGDGGGRSRRRPTPRTGGSSRRYAPGDCAPDPGAQGKAGRPSASERSKDIRQEQVTALEGDVATRCSVQPRERICSRLRTRQCAPGPIQATETSATGGACRRDEEGGVNARRQTTTAVVPRACRCWFPAGSGRSGAANGR